MSTILALLFLLLLIVVLVGSVYAFIRLLIALGRPAPAPHARTSPASHTAAQGTNMHGMPASVAASHATSGASGAARLATAPAVPRVSVAREVAPASAASAAVAPWVESRAGVRAASPTTKTGGGNKARWLGPNEALSIAGYSVPGGLLYVGQGLRSVRGESCEPALVDPRLPVNARRPDRFGEQMPYWPSYAEIDPGCRAAYLEWLAGGRREPAASVGYVFLFFYGLERRLLCDARQAALPPGEHEAIVAEVERLLAIYSHSASFRGYAGGFLDVARALLDPDGITARQPPVAESHWGGPPLALRLGLGSLVAAGRPIPPEWARAWWRSTPVARPRTPATRCAAEFDQLFDVRYRQAFGEGLRLTPNRTKVALSYRPASASFAGEVKIPMGNLPDVTVLTAPLDKLNALAEGCMTELEPYSRRLGRDPAARASIAAAALLPSELAEGHGGADALALVRVAEGVLAGGTMGSVRAGELLGHWPPASDGKFRKADAVLLAQFLQKRGLGLEPDARFGGSVLMPDDRAVVFRLPADAPETPSPGYKGAALMLHLAVMVAQADGEVHASEEQHLQRHMERALRLDETERTRLGAHLRRMIETPVGWAGVKKRLADLQPAQRQALAEFLVSVAAADGRIDPDEIDSLSKAYPLLGLDPEQVYRDIHALGAQRADDAGPVMVREARPRAGARTIPGPGGFSLDVRRVRAKMAETAAVAELLERVFADDEEHPGDARPGAEPAATQAIAPSGAEHGLPSMPGLAGLDGPTSAFLRALAERSSWPRTGLERCATPCGLLPDGAIEILNERAFEVCGRALCEGDDPVEIDQEVLKELLA